MDQYKLVSKLVCLTVCNEGKDEITAIECNAEKVKANSQKKNDQHKKYKNAQLKMTSWH